MKYDLRMLNHVDDIVEYFGKAQRWRWHLYSLMHPTVVENLQQPVQSLEVRDQEDRI
jgi:hypothetical protein